MRTFGKLEILGNAGADAEMRATPGGKWVTNFPVAVNRRWQDQDSVKHEETQWIDVVSWGKLAEMVNTSVKKGDRVLVSGNLRTRTWTGDDGQNRFRIECQAREVTFLEKRDGGIAEVEAERDSEIDDGIPFN